MTQPELRFGISLVPMADDLTVTLELAELADRSGLELFGVQDHPYQRRFADAWMLLATVLARTGRIRVFPDVANLPLRPPAVMAKAAATLDLLSGGRFELGLGAGGFREPVVAMGGPDRAPGESVDALHEAIQVIRRLWSNEEVVSFEGQYYRLDAHKPGPAPAHRIEIWLGAYKPRMLRLVGELADGWVPSLFRGVTPESLGEASHRIDEAADAAGRDPGEVRRIWNVPGTLLEEDVERWIEMLSGWAGDYRVDSFVLWPDGEDLGGQIERFAAEVAPGVRAAAAL